MRTKIIHSDSGSYVPTCPYAPILYEYKKDPLPRYIVQEEIDGELCMLSDYCLECSQCSEESDENTIVCRRFPDQTSDEIIQVDRIGLMLQARDKVEIRLASYSDGSFTASWCDFHGEGYSRRAALFDLESQILSYYKDRKFPEDIRSKIRDSFYIF